MVVVTGLTVVVGAGLGRGVVVGLGTGAPSSGLGGVDGGRAHSGCENHSCYSSFGLILQ